MSKSTTTGLAKRLKQNKINMIFKPVSEKRHAIDVQKQFIADEDRQK